MGAPVVRAQIAPGGLNPAGPGGPGGGSGSDDKKAGVAEAAPQTPGLLPTTPALPAPKARRKRWKLLELDGYYRARTDWFKNFNLGFIDDPHLGGAPFPRALGCSAPPGTNAPCDDSLSSANMRLRLEPTINLDEGTSIHIQADALDNLVFGSTPSDPVIGAGSTSPVANALGASRPPTGAFGNGTQTSVLQGVNSDRPSIEVKRAWAEVAVPFGVFKVGRMPNQWGMGILYNAGGADPINGTYDYDNDYGDSVDRASFSLLIPGTNLRAMAAADWPLTRLVSNQVSTQQVAGQTVLPPGLGHEGHPFDLDDSDDTNSWVGVISRIDSPQEFKDTLDRGEIAFNYGAYFEYKTQEWESNVSNFAPQGSIGVNLGNVLYEPRNLKTYSPDVWAKVGVGRFLIEAELTGQFGSTDVVTAAPSSTDANFVTNHYDIRKLGGAGRFTFKGFEGKLRLGVESGFASGDSYPNTPQGATNIAYGAPFGNSVSPSGVPELAPNGSTLTQFAFNRAYNVDLILWRHLVGAVTNAAYFKPFIQYDITRSITFKVANITSFALKPAATPGDSRAYGTEFDGDLGYGGNGMFFGISYGILFPLGAMNHPDFAMTENPPPANPPYGPTGSPNINSATTAHVIQSRFVLAF
ncbi:MAG TPA: TIGR04551 family protein [Kofleriaceae bacterium]|nr:TIGR04551 family protein [Kofleriaceae bacterium]